MDKMFDKFSLSSGRKVGSVEYKYNTLFLERRHVVKCQACRSYCSVGTYAHHYCDECAQDYLEECSSCLGEYSANYANPHGCADCYNTGLQPKHKENHTMNAKEAIALIQLTNGATIFRAEYLGAQMVPQPDGATIRGYHFKDVIGLNLEADDLVVVQTKDTFGLVKVLAVNVAPAAVGCALADLKHAVCRVDFGALDCITKAEESAAHELAMSEVHERLDAYRKQLGGSFDAVKRLLTGAQPTIFVDAVAVLEDIDFGPTELRDDADFGLPKNGKR